MIKKECFSTCFIKFSSHFIVYKYKILQDLSLYFPLTPSDFYGGIHELPSHLVFFLDPCRLMPYILFYFPKKYTLLLNCDLSLL